MPRLLMSLTSLVVKSVPCLSDHQPCCSSFLLLLCFCFLLALPLSIFSDPWLLVGC